MTHIDEIQLRYQESSRMTWLVVWSPATSWIHVSVNRGPLTNPLAVKIQYSTDFTHHDVSKPACKFSLFVGMYKRRWDLYDDSR